MHRANNGNDHLCRRMEAQKQTSKAQYNIQQMLAQLLTKQNNNDAGEGT